VRRFAALLAAALVAGCSSREHANPFDPENPVTQGRPPGFVALAGSRLVQLRWTRPSLSGDFGYRLFRRADGETDFQQVGSDLGGSATSYFDFGLENGTTYRYRLYYMFNGTAGGVPAEDFGTPGPLKPYCTDLSRRTLIGATADGHHIVSETGGFFGPTHIAVDPSRGVVWISDTYDGEVFIIDPLSGGRTAIRGLAEPVAIALDPIDRSAWVCDQALNAVFHYDAGGLPASPPSLSPITTPIGVATDPTYGVLWVCERGADQVRRYTRTGALIGSTPMGAPSRVAVDSLTSDAWVTSLEGQRVVRISAATGAVVGTVSLSGPIGVAVDARRDRIWVADARAGQLVSVLRGSTIEFRVGGLVETREVAVDVATGDAWVTCPGIRALVRVSAAGAIVERLTDLSDPYGVALDPGQARSP
jgi:DNA-binding beta-propeller fold protein YncE